VLACPSTCLMRCHCHAFAFPGLTLGTLRLVSSLGSIQTVQQQKGGAGPLHPLLSCLVDHCTKTRGHPVVIA
jgi:hypothetical protein